MVESFQVVELGIEEARLELARAELAEAQARLQSAEKLPSPSAPKGQPQAKTEAAVALLKTQLKLAEQTPRAAVARLKDAQRVGKVLVTKPSDAYIWSVRWLHAQRDLSQTK